MPVRESTPSVLHGSELCRWAYPDRLGGSLACNWIFDASNQTDLSFLESASAREVFYKEIWKDSASTCSGDALAA